MAGLSCPQPKANCLVGLLRSSAIAVLAAAWRNAVLSPDRPAMPSPPTCCFRHSGPGEKKCACAVRFRILTGHRIKWLSHGTCRSALGRRCRLCRERFLPRSRRNSKNASADIGMRHKRANRLSRRLTSRSQTTYANAHPPRRRARSRHPCPTQPPAGASLSLRQSRFL